MKKTQIFEKPYGYCRSSNRNYKRKTIARTSLTTCKGPFDKPKTN